MVHVICHIIIFKLFCVNFFIFFSFNDNLTWVKSCQSVVAVSWSLVGRLCSLHRPPVFTRVGIYRRLVHTLRLCLLSDRCPRGRRERGGVRRQLVPAALLWQRRRAVQGVGQTDAAGGQTAACGTAGRTPRRHHLHPQQGGVPPPSVAHVS